MITRRRFLATTGAVAVTGAPFAAGEQQATRVYRIGVLMSLYAPDSDPPRLSAKGFATLATSKDRTSSSTGDTPRGGTMRKAEGGAGQAMYRPLLAGVVGLVPPAGFDGRWEVQVRGIVRRRAA